MTRTEELGPKQFVEYMNGKNIKERSDPLLKFLLWRSLHFAGAGGKDVKPQRYKKFVHMAGAQATRVIRAQKGSMKDAEEHDGDGLWQVRKMFLDDKDKFGNVDELLEEAKKLKQQRDAKGVADDADDDGDGKDD